MSNEPLARVTATYAFCHLVVDLACITTLMGAVVPRLSAPSIGAATIAVLMYDMLAFCLQLPFGALLDVMGRRRSVPAALLSFALVAAGVLCGMGSHVTLTAASVVFVALGNALFHCVGGVEVLGESGGKAAPSGLFISTGAVGVFVGSLAGFNRLAGVTVLLLASLAASAMLVIRAPRSSSCDGLAFSLTRVGWTAVALLAATVALRSYTGMVMAFPWKAEFALAVCSLAAVVAGKALGGIVADVLGSPVTSAISLGGAAVLFAFSWTNPAAGLAGTLLFNFTMAITLSELAHLLPEAHGLAFGIASFSLAVGALPALVGVQTTSAAALCVLSGVSFALLEAGLALSNRASRGH